MVAGLQLSAVVLGAPDAQKLAAFYEALLGWRRAADEPDWVILRQPAGGTALSFQTEDAYRRPVWPQDAGDQQMMLHLDLGTADVPVAVQAAIDAGAELADHQPQAAVTVLLDPAGHPFCIFALPH